MTKAERRKLEAQQDNLSGKIIFSQEFVQQKLELLNQSGGEPFAFIRLDREQNANKFESLVFLSKKFNKTATDQINSSRGDIFTQCIVEMYRLMESQSRDSLPEPLLTEQPVLPEVRSPGDNSKEFCYSYGVALEPKTARWQVLRFMFERPTQRCQSASGEGRPHICATCSALAFVSPLKVTDDSIILRLVEQDLPVLAEYTIVNNYERYNRM